MLLPILEDRGADTGSDVIKTISSRIAGGRRELNTEPSRVRNMVHFKAAHLKLVTIRSSLTCENSDRRSHPYCTRPILWLCPQHSLLATTILTPDMCVERKSLSDLVSSFNSGRLWVMVPSFHHSTESLQIHSM